MNYQRHKSEESVEDYLETILILSKQKEMCIRDSTATTVAQMVDIVLITDTILQVQVVVDGSNDVFPFSYTHLVALLYLIALKYNRSLVVAVALVAS